MNGWESGIVRGVQKGGAFGDVFFRIVTEGGGLGMVLIIAAVILLFFGARAAAKYGFIMTASSVIGYLIKIIAKRPRPFIFNPDVIQKASASGYSLPSGHTLTAVIIALFIFFAISKRARGKVLRGAIAIICILFALLVGFSRVYLGVHYPSDVAAAIVIGIALYWGLSYIWETAWKKFAKILMKH